MSGGPTGLTARQRARAEGYMRRAIALARRARGKTWPNPMVGSVIVRAGRIVGQGYHHRAGRAHAEVEALADAGAKAAGADLYVTLEPCHCHGRTPPCTDAIISAGVKRVFVGFCDPNPRECGAGLEVLRAAGIEVHAGVLDAECEALNEVYNTFIQYDRPHVTVKAATSLDGRIAPHSGDARWISSKESRVRAHRLRAQAEAILVGAGTVRQDDPSLNVRHVRGRDPTVVVLDTRLSTPADAGLVRLERDAPVLIYCGRRAPASHARALAEAGAQVIRVRTVRGRLDLAAVLSDLLARGAWRLLVEGGGTVIGALIAGRLVDRLELAQAPILLGDGGIPLARWRGPTRVADAPRLVDVRRGRSGPDCYLSGRLVWPQ